MPCMGPTQDQQIAELVVFELKKIKELDWINHRAHSTIVSAVNNALVIQRNGEKLTNYMREQMISALVFGFLDFRQIDQIDWESFQIKLNEAIWAFDAADF